MHFEQCDNTKFSPLNVSSDESGFSADSFISSLVAIKLVLVVFFENVLKV